LAFFLAQSNGTDYGIFEVQTGYVVTTTVMPPEGANTLIAYVGPNSNVVNSAGNFVLLDQDNNRLIELVLPNGTFSGGGLRNLNASTGDENVQADNYAIFGPATSLGAWHNAT